MTQNSRNSSSSAGKSRSPSWRLDFANRFSRGEGLSASTANTCDSGKGLERLPVEGSRREFDGSCWCCLLHAGC